MRKRYDICDIESYIFSDSFVCRLKKDLLFGSCVAEYVPGHVLSPGVQAASPDIHANVLAPSLDVLAPSSDI